MSATTLTRGLAAAVVVAGFAGAAYAGTALAHAETASQHNAVAKAQSYINILGFSHDGLIEQLEYNKFTPEDAAYAADHVTVDWNAEAVEKAQSYLRSMAFSKPGLIEQLEYNKFTPAQAQYGADVAYGS